MNPKIFVAGGTGLVGSAIIRNLTAKGYGNIVTTYFSRMPEERKGVRFEKLDLLDQQAVEKFYARERPEQVFFAAAKVGGIMANNTYRGQFLYENLQIQNNIVHQAYRYGVKKLLFLGSSCIYPKNAPQPLREGTLLTDVLEYTNEPYAIAKIAGMKLCENYSLQYAVNFISVMPTNLYGPNDNFHLENSHVLPALLRKTHLAKLLAENDFDGLRRDFARNPLNHANGHASDEILRQELARQGITQENGKTVLSLWGSGTPRREFLHSDDMADACVYLMEHVGFSDILKNDFGLEHVQLPIQTEVRNTHINIGTGRDLAIRELAGLIREIVGFGGEIRWDTSKPDGTYQKLLDVTKLHALGWQETISLENGLRDMYEKYKTQ